MLEKIKAKCDSKKLQSKITTRTFDLSDGDTIERTELFIQIPAERNNKTLIIDSRIDDLDKILESKFENFKFIKGYEGVYSFEDGIIECEIQAGELNRTTSILTRRLEKVIDENLIIYKEDEDGDKYVASIEFPSPKEGIKILIGESSVEFSVLSGMKHETPFFRRKVRSYQTIRIEGVKLEFHDEVYAFLTDLSNSIFFQIDLVTNMPVYLSIDRDLQREIRLRKRILKEDLKLTAPKYKYSPEAISLYWYARTSSSMPLLQYLSYYQILEFYFPQYSYLDAQKKIKNLLKDPTFDSENDNHLAKVLDVVRVTAKGKSFGDEKSQIKATLQYCVDHKELKEYLEEDVERKDFFDIQKKSKSLVKNKISFSKSDQEILIDVANRIYDLRCRIVHTKDENDSELLLPFSTDLAYLKYDIDLIEFIARKVLISSCRNMDFNK
jgi:hypothetical protein